MENNKDGWIRANRLEGEEALAEQLGSINEARRRMHHLLPDEEMPSQSLLKLELGELSEDEQNAGIIELLGYEVRAADLHNSSLYAKRKAKVKIESQESLERFNARQKLRQIISIEVLSKLGFQSGIPEKITDDVISKKEYEIYTAYTGPDSVDKLSALKKRLEL